MDYSLVLDTPLVFITLLVIPRGQTNKQTNTNQNITSFAGGSNLFGVACIALVLFLIRGYKKCFFNILSAIEVADTPFHIQGD